MKKFIEIIGKMRIIGSVLSFILAFSLFSSAQSKPTLTKTQGVKIRLALKGKSAVVDLDNVENVTLGGESPHRYKLFLTTVKADRVYFLFEEQGRSPMSDPNGVCGGDAPQTLIWLKTDLKMKIEEAKSEVFASCAYNGGRYQQGKTQITGNRLKIVFAQQNKKYEINYDSQMPENGFDLTEKNTKK